MIILFINEKNHFVFFLISFNGLFFEIFSGIMSMDEQMKTGFHSVSCSLFLHTFEQITLYFPHFILSINQGHNEYKLFSV